MKLTAVLPPRHGHRRHVDLPRMLTNCLLAACQFREFKRLVGWQGMAVCARGPQGWTFKLRTRPGVFGLATEDTRQDASGHHARLGLYYFPAAEELLLEAMSLAANQAAAQPGYTENLRRFTAMGPWSVPFHMGTVAATLSPDEDALQLTLSAVDRKVCIASDGIRTHDGQWLIRPGEAEEDFPAHAIATGFFLVLAAAVSNSLEVPPVRAARTTEPARALSYDAQGSFTALDELSRTLGDHICWGRAACSAAQVDNSGDTGRTPLPEPLQSALFWKTHDLAALSAEEAFAPAFDTRPGMIVLSGFLGAGKTTFLNQLLEYHAARDELVAIIQNEIGQTGVDGRLLEGDDSIVELDEGCVCCTLAGSLSRGIRQLRERFNPKVIVLESTGLANPFNILHEVETLRPLVRLDSVTTLVDAVNATALLKDFEIARDQVRAADILLLNKCDLVEASTLEQLRTTLTGLNRRAMLVETTFGAVNPGILYDIDPLDRQPDQRSWLPRLQHHTHRDDGFAAHRFAFHNPVNRTRLQNALNDLPDAVFRLKGIVHLDDAAQPEVVQYVCGRHELSPLGDAFEQEGFLVAIGRNMDLGVLENLERIYA